MGFAAPAPRQRAGRAEGRASGGGGGGGAGGVGDEEVGKSEPLLRELLQVGHGLDRAKVLIEVVSDDEDQVRARENVRLEQERRQQEANEHPKHRLITGSHSIIARGGVEWAPSPRRL